MNAMTTNRMDTVVSDSESLYGIGFKHFDVVKFPAKSTWLPQIEAYSSFVELARVHNENKLSPDVDWQVSREQFVVQKAGFTHSFKLKDAH